MLSKTILFGSAIIALHLQSLDVATVYKRASRSVCVVIAMDQHNQPLALGSGFFVDSRGTFATNYHVIHGAQSVFVKLGGQTDPLAVEGVYGVDTKRDLALLKIPTTSSAALALSPERPLVGERVIAIGNPLGLESTVSEGIVSGIRSLEEDFELYQITAPISPGSSGGPVLSREGQVLGVATLSLKDAQNLNFAVPIIYLDQLRKSATSVQPVPDMTSVKPGLEAETANGKELVRFIDTRLEPNYSGYSNDINGSVYNGTQYKIQNIKIRVIGYREGIDVPIDYIDATLARVLWDERAQEISGKPIPPGLSRPFHVFIINRTQKFEIRLLGYEIAR